MIISGSESRIKLIYRIARIIFSVGWGERSEPRQKSLIEKIYDYNMLGFISFTPTYEMIILIFMMTMMNHSLSAKSGIS